MKSKPIGVRFDVRLMERIKEQEGLSSPQQVLSFLEMMWENLNGKTEAKVFIEEAGEVNHEVFKQLVKKKRVLPAKVESKVDETPKSIEKVVPKKIEHGSGSEPKEGSGAFYLKYGAMSYAEVEGKPKEAERR